EVFGVTAQDVIGKTDLQIFERDTARQFREKDLDTMRTLSPVETLDEFTLRAGKVIIKSVRFPIFDAEGTIKSICTQATDISKELHANEQLRLAGKIFERTSEAILVTDANQRILTTNETFAELTGFSQQELTGKTPKLLESGEHSKDFFIAMKASLTERGFWQGEVINKVKDGSHVKMWLTVNAVKGANGDIVNYVAAYSNIDEIKNMQRRIEYLATHDELTGLPNRTVLLERLELMISGAKRSKQLCGVLFVDLDNFKPVNDNLGHKVGDLLLKQVTKRLQQCIRDTDMLARIGGDEFVALISASHIDEIDDIAKRIISQVQNEFDVSTHSISVSASIGIAVYPADGISSEILLQHADEAMYLAKSSGRNQYQYFTAKMKEQALARLEVEKQLKVALEGKQFSMVYQPQFESTSNAIIGAEALLRYRNSDGEVLNAESFINIAERGKLIESIGFHAVELVAREIAQYIQLGNKLPAIAINLSGAQLLTSDFIKKFVTVLERYELTAGLFKFEVSEKDIESGEERIYHRLKTLASMGSIISIDDYGLYNSAISQLQRSGASEIKLSSHLLNDASDNNDRNKLIQALITAGKALGLKIIANKVETQQQLESLQDFGCDIIQGLVLSPMLTCSELNKKVSQ
ncbi:putative bifunctional diguanylate cyclase/phosphodiesterase, partial [Alteromonas stellipolaris]